MQTLRLAARNLRRHLRRTLITVAAIALGLALLIVSSGIGDGVHGQMIAAGVSAMAGHVVVQAPGWQETREPALVVGDAATVASELQRLVPDATVLSRLYLQGLLTSPKGSVGVALSAVEPALEAQVNDLDDKLVAGRYLDSEPAGLVLGKALAAGLVVDVGDKVVLMLQQRGEIVSRPFRVQGIFAVGIDEIDGFYGHILLGTAQALLGVGTGATQISLHLPSERDSAETAARVRAALDGRGLDVRTWPEALPELYEWVLLDNGGMYLFVLIIAAIVGLGIMNTVLMSVLERLREFGVLLALGHRPLHLAAVVLCEAALLGAIAVVAGVGLGLLGNWPIAVWGIDATAEIGGSMEAAGVAMSNHWYSDLSAAKVVLFAALALIMTLAAAVYPALKAATLDPIQCLRHH